MKFGKIEKLAIGVVVFSWLAWWPVYSAFWGNGENPWFLAIILFSLNFSIWGLFVILEKNVYKNLVVLSLANLPAFFMFKDSLGLAILGFVFMELFLLLGVKVIREEFEERIQVQIFKSLRFGLRFLILGFAVVFSLGIFSLLKNEKILEISTPKIQIDKKSTISTLETAGNFITDQQIKEDLKLLREDLKLMDFIAQSNFFKEEAPLIQSSDEFKTIFLEKLASQLDFEKLTGEEKTLTLTSQFFNKKINAFFGFLEEKNSNAVSAWVGAVTIFFVIYSLGWFLGGLIRGLSVGWFCLMKKNGWLRAEEVEDKREKIEF